MLRMGFDPELPLVATSAFSDGTVAAGEVFDWRANGMQSIDVLPLYQAGLVTHPSPAPAALPAATAQPDSFTPGGAVEVRTELDASQVVAFTKTPGETVHVPPPSKPKAERHGRSR